MLVVLIFVVMASLVGLVDRLDASRAKLRRAQNAAAALQLAKLALLGYAVAYRDNHDAENFGYLPCPDTAGSGVEQTPCGKAGKIAVGLLPYKTLALPDLRDADGNCLWYAVSGTFKNNPKSAPFNWDTQGQLTVRTAAGTMLAAPDDRLGGAAAVIIAPGAALAARRASVATTCGADPDRAGAYLENAAGVFTQGSVTDGSGNVVGNDRLAWIAPKEIFDGIVKRRDFAAYLNTGIAAIRAKLGKQPAEAANALPVTNPFDKDTQASDHNLYDAWKDQFKYLHCAGCYADGAGGRYDGMLLFGGRDASGNPRPSTARAPADYFETALDLAQGQAFAPCSPGPASFDNASGSGRAADIALCLAPPAASTGP
ncbi:MAG: hypothetical protein PHY45_11530 [Rhodocyclaceae bacterium]|nr:hypothetical protein [Rhodocyclaceae bacterium]